MISIVKLSLIVGVLSIVVIGLLYNEFQLVDPEVHVDIEKLISPREDESKLKKNTWGFFHQCHRQEAATKHVVNQVRRFFPTEQYILVADQGGSDYSEFAKKMGVDFRQGTRKATSGNGVIGDFWVWFRRLQQAAEKCNCEFLIYLEDDMIIFRRPNTIPKYDAGGVDALKWVGSWPHKLIDKWESEQNRPVYHSHGLCGGTYVRADVLKGIDIEKAKIRIENLKTFGVHLMGSATDITYAAILLDLGYEIWPWKEELRDLVYDDYKDVAIGHGDKTYYPKIIARRRIFIFALVLMLSVTGYFLFKKHRTDKFAFAPLPNRE